MAAEDGSGQLLRHVKVSYEGWASGHAEFDEWFSVSSDRLAPANSHVPRSSGLEHCKRMKPDRQLATSDEGMGEPAPKPQAD